MGHVAAPESSSAERRGLELRDTWQHWSPQWGGGVQSCGIRGSTGALLSVEVGYGATGHMAALEHSVGRRGSELWDTCQHRSPP
jgi:hypothetical protein